MSYPQLPERLNALYNDVVSNFEAPSTAQNENIKLLTDRFTRAKKIFQKYNQSVLLNLKST